MAHIFQGRQIRWRRARLWGWTTVAPAVRSHCGATASCRVWVSSVCSRYAGEVWMCFAEGRGDRVGWTTAGERGREVLIYGYGRTRLDAVEAWTHAVRNGWETAGVGQPGGLV